MKFYYVILVMALLQMSCARSSDQARFKEVVSSWRGKHVVMPDSITDIMSGDTIVLGDADFTILTYVDSAGCTGCKMKLPLWEKFYESIDSITDADVRPLMVVCTEDKHELLSILTRESYHYPVYIDDSDEIAHKNGFPDNPVLQTFLLDRNLNVIAIGNPVYSESLSELYKSIISGRQIFDSTMVSMVCLDNNLVDVGKMRPGDTAVRSVSITNQSDDTIFVKEIVSSCDCTNASIHQNLIPPHETIPIELTVNAENENGDFERIVNVFYDGYDYPSIIRIRGTIRR